MTVWQKLTAAGAITAMLWGTWMFRFDMQAVSPGGEGIAPIAYVLDRWTGTAHVLFPSNRKTLQESQRAP